MVPVEADDGDDDAPEASQQHQNRNPHGAPAGFSDDEQSDGGDGEIAPGIEDEVDIYLKMERVKANVDPFEWWIAHEEELPYLTKMALDYLSIPSSSISTERANSVARYRWEDRVALSDEIFRKEMCLESWISKLNLDEIDLPEDVE